MLSSNILDIIHKSCQANSHSGFSLIWVLVSYFSFKVPSGYECSNVLCTQVESAGISTRELKSRHVDGPDTKLYSKSETGYQDADVFTPFSFQSVDAATSLDWMIQSREIKFSIRREKKKKKEE